MAPNLEGAVQSLLTQMVMTMLKRQPVSKIIYQGETRIMYRVPSKKSKPGGSHVVEFTKFGDRRCGCIGNGYIEKKGDDMFHDCRHKKMNTIYVKDPGTRNEIELMNNALHVLTCKGYRGLDMSVTWADIFCQQPKYHNPIAIYCRGCPLFPEVCNIHRMRTKRNKLPLVWKLQGQIYAGHKKEAARTLRKIIKRVRKVYDQESKQSHMA